MASLLVERARRLATVTPWQRVADSPTTKYYTNWSLFEKAINMSGELEFRRPRGSWDLVLGPCGNAYNYDIDESVLDLSASRLYAEHIARLDGAHKIEPEGGTLRIALCEPSGPRWYSYHLLINVNNGIEQNLLIYAPRSAPGTTGIEVRAKKGSKVNLVVLAEPELQEYPMAYIIRRALGVDAYVRSVTLAKASIMTRVDEQSIMASNSRLYHDSFVMTSNGQTLDNVIDTVQGGHDSVADVSGFGASSGSSTVAVRGTVVMTPQAVKSSSNFVVEALLLSDQSKAYTMPMMRIDNGDILSATHRAAQYRVPLEQLFYLETRGLSYPEAVELLLRGRLMNALRSLPEALLGPALDLGSSVIRAAINELSAGATQKQVN